jgi:hypothetical protein
MARTRFDEVKESFIELPLGFLGSQLQPAARLDARIEQVADQHANCRQDGGDGGEGHAHNG